MGVRKTQEKKADLSKEGESSIHITKNQGNTHQFTHEGSYHMIYQDVDRNETFSTYQKITFKKLKIYSWRPWVWLHDQRKYQNTTDLDLWHLVFRWYASHHCHSGKSKFWTSNPSQTWHATHRSPGNDNISRRKTMEKSFFRSQM